MTLDIAKLKAESLMAVKMPGSSPLIGVVLELIAALEAKDAQIAELDGALEREREKSRRMASRIAELEARKITVRFDAIPMSDLGNRSDGKKHPYLFGAGYNSATAHCESELRRACAAAGINLETGGE